jgi:hypothetical protein
MDQFDERWLKAAAHYWVLHRMGIDPGLAEVPPALLPSLRADIPALHDAPESKI